MGWIIFEKVGFFVVVSVGNKSDIDDVDFFEYFKEDENIRVIFIYMEGVKDGRCFMEVVKDVSMVKLIVVIKVGRSECGVKVVVFYIGLFVGSDKVFDVVFK